MAIVERKRGALASLLTEALLCRINGKLVCAKKAAQRINIIPIPRERIR